MLSSVIVIISLSLSTLAAYLPPLNILEDIDSTEYIVASLAASNFHGAPYPPEFAESTPGWYFGDDPGSAEGLPWLKDTDLCAVLAQTSGSLRCPPVVQKPTKSLPKRSAAVAAPTQSPTVSSSSPSYYTVFSGRTGAIQGSGYLTYGLVDSVADCQTMCNKVSGCVFVNSYHDVNGKNGSPLLTCSLYSIVHSAAEATNYGGQRQPDGSYDYITDSAGYALSQ
ncbi:hypothetical protein DFH05DRAFT_1056192 [Lentinula detonsa]|uniref:Fruit-body specific protein a n=3 Tax=Lentinula TaxID=5352 RepID=A0AA38NMG8_9AGAR|nr:hypothetical protein DFH05DRAFT_1056192 [Lentinula detonsa]KAJ3786469.1 hypothetical protein GGU10DRAFT_419587 [Lentinula aff. detonsa]KAJ3801080.1 hypothetical protein GGU11DRAFT_286267 [Lentinula aff. detonsa]